VVDGGCSGSKGTQKAMVGELGGRSRTRFAVAVLDAVMVTLQVGRLVTAICYALGVLARRQFVSAEAQLDRW